MVRSRVPTQLGQDNLPTTPAHSPRLGSRPIARCAEHKNNKSWAQRAHVDCLTLAPARVFPSRIRKSSSIMVRAASGPLMPNRNPRGVSSFSCSSVTQCLSCV
jgi:hypothetical protein